MDTINEDDLNRSMSDGVEDGIPSERLQAIIRNLELNIRSGKTLDEARRELVALLGLPEDQVGQGVELIRRRMRAIHNREIPRTMTAEGRESWYLGPDLQGDRFWPALLTLLQDEEWDSDSLEDLDHASTKVVSMLDHPRTGEFKTKGMVLGYVQSGKTTNFTSVIAKAADAGYRLFIVLSGIHDGLRQQTQERLEAQLIAQEPERWIALTDLQHDFRPDVNVNAYLTGDKKVLCVVKKNSYRLHALKKWLEGAQESVLRNCPTLVIDDEADQASVNTARDQNSPSTINRRIREILETMPKVGYVGYTATPFANVLIDPSVSHDLYPRDFIVDLPQPREYVGPETIFGREPLLHDQAEEDAAEGLDMIRIVPDDELEELRPLRRDVSDFAPAATPSLRAAIRYFLMSTAARRVRGLGNPHATMLVHTTMRVLIHEEFRGIIETQVGAIRTALAADDQDQVDSLRRQWEEEMNRVPADGLPVVGFDELRERLGEVVDDVRVVVDNSRSEDRLQYGDEPVTAIAVGGNTLSRGLTLEGLCVSFFVRTTNAYDTLLQMGRWFGYRHGYHDLPRIWTTVEMSDWFRHLAGVEREIRHDIERYELEHRTPLDFGPRVATHPQLAITAASKMRAAVPAEISYSGRRLQTIRFRHRDPDWLGDNRDAAIELLRTARTVEDVDYERPAEGSGIAVLRNVPADAVCSFIRDYRFSERSFDLNSAKIASYIEAQNEVGELQRFSVGVMGRGGGEAPNGHIDLGLEDAVPLIVRSRLRNVPHEEADIKALMSKEDRAVDLDVSDQELAKMNNGELGRLRNSPTHGGHGDGSGLLLLYPVAKDSAPSTPRSRQVREALDAVENVVGLGLVFPEAQTTEGRQTYYTVDLRNMVIEEPLPEDELDEEDDPTEAVSAG
jgi:Z1 domain